MDDMSKYLNALGESSAGTAKVDSMNAAFVDQTSSFNAKLRNIHSEVMGATDPVGLGFVAKGVGKIGSKVVDRVATKSLQNINEQMTAITDRGAARLAGNAVADEPIDVQTGLTADESSQLDNLVSQSKLAGNFTSSTETAITPNEPAATTVTDGEQLRQLPPKPQPKLLWRAQPPLRLLMIGIQLASLQPSGLGWQPSLLAYLGTKKSKLPVMCNH